MRRGRARGMRGGPGRMPPYMRGPPGQKFVVSHSTFDPVMADSFFPRTTPASDETAFTQALLKRNQELTPNGQEQAAVQNLVTKVTTVLDNLIVTPDAADLGLEEVRAVGSFKKGTMLLGHPVADLAVILKKLPTESMILALATRVQKSLKEEGSTAEYPMQANEGGFNISSPEGALVRVLITTLPKNLQATDPAQHVDVKLLEGALATIRHARWFEENAFHTSTRMLVRLFKDLRKRFTGLQGLTPWLIDLLAHRAAMVSTSRQPLPVNIAFRDTKLTHLFKNFFDGEGKVRMTVCLNPNADDYDESVHVMKFAEVTQDVVIARPQSVRFDTGLTPGRRGANQMYKEVLAHVEENGEDNSEKVIIAKPPHTMGPPFPAFELNSPDDNTTLINLIHFLQERQRRRQTLIDDLSRKEGSIFRAHLLELEKENSQATTVISNLKSTIEEKDRDIQKLERRLKALTQKNEMLQKTAEMYEQDKKELKYELDDQKKRADKEKNDKAKMRQALKGVVSQEKDKWERECSKRVKDKEMEMQTKMWQKDEKLRQLKEIVQNMKTNDRPVTRAQAKAATLTRSKSPPPVARKPPIKSRRRRSKSSDCWIEHKPPTHLDTDTVLKPSLRNKKTVCRPDGKDFKATNYVLAHQEEDSAGEIETKLIKGDVFKTVGGGHAIQFTEVETLKTRSNELTSPGRKRRASDSVDDESHSSWTDIETRCSTAIEGRPGLDPSYCHTAAKKKKP